MPNNDFSPEQQLHIRALDDNMVRKARDIEASQHVVVATCCRRVAMECFRTPDREMALRAACKLLHEYYDTFVENLPVEVAETYDD